MTCFSTSAIVLPRQLTLLLATSYYTYVTLHLLVYILLRNNVLCILYSKCTPLTDTSLFSPMAFAKGFISCLKDAYLSRQKGHLMGHLLYTLC
jgi:hypothetical protein